VPKCSRPSLRKAWHCPHATPRPGSSTASASAPPKKALVYLGRYLYRGVIQEKDIIACDDGQVTFRYRESKGKRLRYRTLPGAQFLALLLQHVLPKGFRRARNFGFLHPNSKRSIGLLQYLLGLDPRRALAWLKPRPRLQCPCCGAEMRIVKTRLSPRLPWPAPIPIPITCVS
jgi:hypothetical protein